MKRLTGFLPHIMLGLVLPVLPAACDGDSEDEAGDDEGDENGEDSDEGEDDDPGGCADPDDPNVEKEPLSEDIEDDTTLTCDRIWILQEIVFVRGATLTIEPGTLIQGLDDSALVIEKDAMIVAEGTADAPIVMTSNNPAGSRNRGDWGGLVLLGDAPVNLAGGVGNAEGFPDEMPTYGGSDATHNCGSLKYLRVEWAGNEVSPGNELNGITFYACGTETKVDHIQSHMGQDDGIEMFGGSFDLRHVVVTGAGDDSIDVDQGFYGTIQYVYVQQDPGVGEYALEWSNQGADFSLTPKTRPVLVNATMVGSGSGGDKSRAANLKEGTQAEIWSSIIMDFTNGALLMTHGATQEEAESGDIVLRNNLFFANGTPEFNVAEDTTWMAADFEAWVKTEENENVFGTDPELGSTSWTTPDPTPAASSSVAGNGATPSGVESTDYIGAVEPGAESPWTRESWINYAVD